ncbi:hypothetical protein GCM10023084_37050 [Streptomyces lacrimifluminis]|uniref:Uncharacterized protein n=1 Tax=Streptomyces lacrimifluminis TaxID=1500077 RepID=A0A917L237_9ACTN|nr:hypothetical protein GCM10012282_36900 [Streptomyces lacrimifluminis]
MATFGEASPKAVLESINEPTFRGTSDNENGSRNAAGRGMSRQGVVSRPWTRGGRVPGGIPFTRSHCSASAAIHLTALPGLAARVNDLRKATHWFAVMKGAQAPLAVQGSAAS